MKPIDEEIIARLYAWFLEQKVHGKPVTDTLFLEKSIEISKALGSPTVTVTKDWLCAVKKRYNINCEKNDGTESASPYTTVYVKEECVNDKVSTDPPVEEDDLKSLVKATMGAPVNPPEGAVAIKTEIEAQTTINAMPVIPALLNGVSRIPASVNAMTRAQASMEAMMGAPAGINTMSGGSSVINVNATPYIGMYMDPSMYSNSQTYMNTFINAPTYVNATALSGSVTYTNASADRGLNLGENATNVGVSENVGVPAANAEMDVVAPSYMDIMGINTTMNISGPSYVNTPLYMKARPTANRAAFVNATESAVAATVVETTVGTKLEEVQNVEMESAEQLFLKDFARRLERQKISYKNIYYAKDTGLAWKAFPKKLLERCMKRKNRVSLFEKERVTVFLCTNAAGSHKLAPLFVHKLEKPKALKHCKNQLSVIFTSQSQAQIDHDVFAEWYEKHFKPTVKIFQFPEKEGKVLLLLDDYQKHSLQLARELEQNDDNFEIVLLPPGAASLAKPIEQKMVENTKKFYRLKMLRRVLNFSGGARKFYYDFDLKDCIDLFSEAWTEVAKSGIQTAWSGIVKRTSESCLIKEELEEDPLEPNLRDIIGLITGEEEPEETVNEFLLRCEDTERHFLTDQVEDDEEDDDEDEDEGESENDDEVLSHENVKKAFETLVTWAKQHPQYIQLQVEYLKSYYESSVKDKRVERKY